MCELDDVARGLEHFDESFGIRDNVEKLINDGAVGHPLVKWVAHAGRISQRDALIEFWQMALDSAPNENHEIYGIMRQRLSSMPLAGHRVNAAREAALVHEDA